MCRLQSMTLLRPMSLLTCFCFSCKFKPKREQTRATFISFTYRLASPRHRLASPNSSPKNWLAITSRLVDRKRVTGRAAARTSADLSMPDAKKAFHAKVPKHVPTRTPMHELCDFRPRLNRCGACRCPPFGEDLVVNDNTTKSITAPER